MNYTSQLFTIIGAFMDIYGYTDCHLLGKRYNFGSKFGSLDIHDIVYCLDKKIEKDTVTKYINYIGVSGNIKSTMDRWVKAKNSELDDTRETEIAKEAEIIAKTIYESVLKTQHIKGLSQMGTLKLLNIKKTANYNSIFESVKDLIRKSDKES